MKKKLLWCAIIIVLIGLVVLCVLRYVEVQRLRSDPNWIIAEKIYKTEKALKEVDEGFACESISRVIPYTYADSDGNTIVYYCCLVSVHFLVLFYRTVMCLELYMPGEPLYWVCW